jgi:uncharacterized membrane protein
LSFKGDVWRRALQEAVIAYVREILFLVGLGLTSLGLAWIYLPAAVIVPGVILMWLAIPPMPSRRNQ